jgi:hypothetical protein
MDTAKQTSPLPHPFAARALTTLDHVLQRAHDMTDTLGLPEEARYAVLSGMFPTLLEHFCSHQETSHAARRHTELLDHSEET